MQNQINIRILNPAEAPPMDLLLSADPSRELVEGYLQRGVCYVAEHEQRFIGVYVLLPVTHTMVELISIAVDEDFQGRGLGKKLTRHAIQTAKAMGFRQIEVGTGNSSLSQLGLYQKCGFRVVGVDRDFFIRNYPEAIYENGIQCMDMIRLSQGL